MKKLSVTFAILIVMIFAVIAYVFTHELGHGLVAVASGGHITRFSIALAHIWYDGAGTTPFITSFIHIAGMLLPVLLLFVGLFFYNRNTKKLLYQLAYGLLSVLVPASVSSWVFLPIMSLFTQIPPGDDVTKFLNTSNLPPLLVALMGVIIIALLVLLALVKKLPQGFISCFKAEINAKSNKSVLSRKVLTGLFAAVILLVSVAILLEIPFLFSKSILSVTVSDPVTSTDYERNFSFVTDRSGTHELDVKLSASGFVTDIRIVGKAGNVVYQNIAETISSKNDFVLESGEYAIHVTHLYDLAAFEDYCNAMNYTFNGDADVIKTLKSAYEKEKQEPFLSLVIK